MELSTYFRINAKDTGQFERTLIVADEGAYVSYLEGCTAPCATPISCTRRWSNWWRSITPRSSIHVQNWYPGDKEGKGGIYNFVNQAGRLPRREFQDFVDPGGDRLGHHLEVSELPADGRQLRGRVLSVALTNNWPAGRHRHQDDPHREEHHQHHRFQGISAGHGQNTTAAASRF